MQLILNNYKQPLLYNNFYNFNSNLYTITRYPIILYKPDKFDILLLGSITLETLSTIALKKTLNNKLWFIPVYSGYGLSFYIFPKVLEKYSLSFAYTLWCGIGIILTTIIDKIIYRQTITLKKILSSLIIIYGINLSK
tara:strand:+ start:2117 stop:2530 length:414 start_codon:yes stop_codon:yes gene_type:complete